MSETSKPTQTAARSLADRLRDKYPPDEIALRREAAAEIERLRVANAALRENARMWAKAAGAIFEDVSNG